MKSLHRHFHWFYYKKGKKHLFGLILSAFFWLFLSITQPFGIHSEGFLPFMLLLIWLLPMAASWFIIIYLLDYLFDRFLPVKPRERIGMDLVGWLIKLTVIIHAIFLFRAYSCDWRCMDLLEYGQLIFGCLLIFFLVYVPFANYAKSIYLKSVFTGDELELSDHEVQLGEGKNPFIISLPEVIYIQADDNHVDIFLLREAREIKKRTYRSTLTRIERLLKKKHPSFIRVHRSYIVNLNYFKAFETSSGTYRLDLQACEQEFQIPVSRKYKPALQQLI